MPILRTLADLARLLPLPRRAVSGGNLSSLFSAFTTPTGRFSRSRRARRARGRLFGFGAGQIGMGGLSSFTTPPSIASIGGGLSQILGGAGMAAGAAIGGPVGAVVGGVSGVLGSFGTVVSETADRLKRLSDTVLGSSLKFSRFSADMSSVQAEQLGYDIARSQRLGEHLAPSARRAVQAQEMFMNVIGEDIQGGFGEIWHDFKEMLSDIGTSIARVWDFSGESEARFQRLQQSAQKSLEEFAKAKGKPIDEDLMREYMESVGAMGRPRRFD